MTTDAAASPPVRPWGIDKAYKDRGKSVIVLTGDTRSVYWSSQAGKYLPIEQTLFQALSPNFIVMGMDAGKGIRFYDDRQLDELQETTALADVQAEVLYTDKIGELRKAISQEQFRTLPSLVLLQQISEGVGRVRRTKGNETRKRLCVIVRYADFMFPQGAGSQLPEADRRVLIQFLNWVANPLFQKDGNMVILLADTKASINKEILAVPTTAAIELDLPNDLERRHYLETRLKDRPFATDLSLEVIVNDTAGVNLVAIEDILEGVPKDGKLERAAIQESVNAALSAQLDGSIRILKPLHGAKDVSGQVLAKQALQDVLNWSLDPSKAVPGCIVSGPNGGGKTFIVEAVVGDSDLTFIELTGLRSMWYGETDRMMEKLRSVLRRFKRVVVFMDEAHTALSSVHKNDTHETDKRLSGTFIKMMGDPAYLGVLVWVLGSSRPDELDPDVLRRMPVQIPIFDPEGEERKTWIIDFFGRKGLTIADSEMSGFMEITAKYSAGDFNNLRKQCVNRGLDPVAACAVWRAKDLSWPRRLQTLIAADHCTVPELLPQWLRDRDAENIRAEIELLKRKLGY